MLMSSCLFFCLLSHQLGGYTPVIARCGKEARCGKVRQGVARCGLVWQGVARGPRYNKKAKCDKGARCDKGTFCVARGTVWQGVSMGGKV